jgi:hypothetical protein
MANIKNFGIQGVGSDVQFGKAGGRLTSNGSVFQVLTANGSLTRLQASNPSTSNDVVTKQHQDNAVSVINTAAGLLSNSAYLANSSANYIYGATSLANADNLLDSAIKAEVDARNSNAAALYQDIQTETTNRVSNASELYSNIQTEISNRTSNASELWGDIDTETTARVANAAELWGDINTEFLRASAAETAINTAISNETYRAQGAESAINTAVTAETNRAQGAESAINTAVTAETNRAQGAESDINTAVSNEVYRAQGAESAINSTIQTETYRAQGAESAINSAIQTETYRAQGAEDAINTAITAETNRASGAETAINSAISTETYRAQGAENSINTVVTALSNAVIYKNGNTAFTGDQSMGGHALTNLATPSDQYDASTKKYVDDQIASLGQVFNFVGNINGGTQGAPTDMSTAGASASDRDAGSYYHVATAGYFTLNTTTIYAEALDAIVFNTSGGIDRIAHVDTVVNGTSDYIAVSGNIDTGFTVDIAAAFKTRLSNAETDISTLQTDLTAETNRAEGAETAINTAVSNETYRAQGAENAINTAILAEQYRASNAETSINTAISNEVYRAQGAENDINTAISNETYRAQGAENAINTAVSNETYRAQGAENSINTAILAEQYRASNAETSINTAISNEVYRAQGAETAINSAIQTETYRAQGAESAINSAIQTETYRAQGAESDINTAISNEVYRAQGAENSINSAISTETYRAEGAEYAINTAITSTNSNVAVEISRAEGAETAINSALSANNTRIANLEANSVQLFSNVGNIEASVDLNSDGTLKAWSNLNQYVTGSSTFKAAIETLDSSLASEVTARQSNAAELYGDIQQEITDRANAVTAEANRAGAAESSINTAISNETYRAQGAEYAINTAILTEQYRASNAETSINTAISNETYRAQGAETAINTAIQSETYRAEGAEMAINTAILAEQYRASNAETSINTAISNETYRAQGAENDINTAISNETYRAQGAENAINTAIQTETYRAEGAELSINTVISTLSNAVIYKNGNTAFTGDQSMGSYKLTNLGTPSDQYDASTKKYVDDQIASLGQVFNFVGTVSGGTQVAPTDMGTQGAGASDRDAGSYYHVSNAGYFSYGATTIYAEALDAIVFNTTGGIDRIAHVDTVVQGTSSYVSVSGNIDTGFTVDIAGAFKDRVANAESDITSLKSRASALEGNVATLQSNVADLYANAGSQANDLISIEGAVGLTGNSYTANATAHYVNAATTVINSINLLDTELKSTNDALALLHTDYIYSGNNLFKVQTTNTAVEIYGDVGGVSGKIGQIVAGSSSNANFSLDLSASGVVALNAGRRSGTSATDIALAPYNGGNVVINGSTVVGNSALTISGGSASDLTLQGGYGGVGQPGGSVKLADGNGDLVLTTGTGSAVGYLTVDGGSSVTLSTSGSGTDIDLVLAPKGAGSVNASNAAIINVATPSNATDAANRGYVDDALMNAFVGTVRSFAVDFTETDGSVNIGTFKGTAVRVRVMIDTAFTSGTAITVGRTGAADELVTANTVDEANTGLYIIDSMKNYATNTTVMVTVAGSGGGSGAGKVLVEYVQG